MTPVIDRYNDSRPAPSETNLTREKDGPRAWRTIPEEDTNGGSQVVLSQAFSLTAQELKDSTLTPHTIIPAPGPGKLLVPTMYVFHFEAGGTPFTADGVDLVYGDQDLNVIFNGLTGAGFVGWTVGAFSLGTSEGGAAEDYVDQPVNLAANLRGAIVATQGASVGTGYAVGDTGTVDDGTTLATYVVDSLGGILGEVNTFTITDGGDGYILGAGRSGTLWTTTPGGAQPGSGDGGFEMTVSSVDASDSAGDGTISGTVFYMVADV